ncbi:MAG: patatin-like phospholipase family protein [Pseudomonadota bacterium]
MRIFRRERRLNLALQGGGVHGAFTWGVLDRLLGEEGLQIGWISGTSAGAVNAVAVANGLANGSAALAQETLSAIWYEVEKAGVTDLLRLNPFLFGLAKAGQMPNMTAFFSPYSFNPGGFDPLRKILEEHIDFEAIRKARDLELVLAATDVATGRARFFGRSEVTVDVVLASACLPTLHHAVEIDGRSYWDGGFSANPDLLKIAAESPIADTLLVLLNPLHHANVPKSAKAIEDRVNTVTFNQPLIRDIEAILRARKASDSWLKGRDNPVGRMKAHRFHLISAGEFTEGLGASSKIMPDKELLEYLVAAGRQEGQLWLADNKSHIGKRSTVDLQETFFSDPVVEIPEPDLKDAG